MKTKTILLILIILVVIYFVCINNKKQIHVSIGGNREDFSSLEDWKFENVWENYQYVRNLKIMTVHSNCHLQKTGISGGDGLSNNEHLAKVDCGGEDNDRFYIEYLNRYSSGGGGGEARCGGGREGRSRGGGRREGGGREAGRSREGG